MVILGIDSSAKSVSAAVSKDGKIIGETFLNSGLTHSVTLMPIIENLYNNTGLSVDDTDAVAVTCGPGSFTGVRIGIATAKGICFKNNIKCCPVSTLEAIAYPLINSDATIVSVMDARRNQVYNANFFSFDFSVSRITEDRAISLDDLGRELSLISGKKILIGDGADISYNYLIGKVDDLFICSPELKFQRASSACLIANDREDDFVESGKLEPVYLRPPQAERMLRKKSEENKI
jgi:tRNA threonylcarbamoyladenosine biosynthesis protein TsaB